MSWYVEPVDLTFGIYRKWQFTFRRSPYHWALYAGPFMVARLTF